MHTCAQVVSELEGDVVRFLSELELRGYSDEVLLKYWFHPVVGSRLRSGALMDPDTTGRVLQEVRRRGGGGGRQAGLNSGP